MTKSVFAVVISVLLLGCSSLFSPVSQTQPVPGIYYLPASSDYGQPQAYIWNGSTFRVGSVNQGILSVSYYSFEGDSVANLTVIDAGKSFSARSRRLPISLNDYRVADSAHPFSGLYGTADNSYIFSIADSGALPAVVGYVKIIYPPAMSLLADGMCLNNYNNNSLVLTGRNWGGIIRTSKTVLLWKTSDASIQLIGMDGCGS